MAKRRKPPVVMIHGAFCGPWSLVGFQGHFEKAGYTVRLPCLRFHDGAPPPAALGTTGLADFLADLEEEIAALETAPILFGYSMGGLLAQMVAARRRTAGVILLAPCAPWGVPPSTLFEIAAAQTLLLHTGFWNLVLEPNRDAALASSFNQLPRELRESVLSRLVPESGRATFEMMHWGMDMKRASEVNADAVQCPLLLLSGSEDRVNPPTTVSRIAALYKERATHETIPNMGHWLIGEPGWEKVAARAVEWANRL
jgi:pimeloyl-ACP methyl ester carboxylesterase